MPSRLLAFSLNRRALVSLIRIAVCVHHAEPMGSSLSQDF